MRQLGKNRGHPQQVEREVLIKSILQAIPTYTIMEATDSRSGSYAWRSILKGRDVLQRGARWRVGNGESIKI